MKTADTCCTGDCLQGRTCPLGNIPTRRVLGLRTDEGGEHVDIPPITPERVAGWITHATVFAVIVALAIVSAVLHLFS